MSDQSIKQWIVAFTMKNGPQFRYIVKDSDAGRELLNAVSRQAQLGKPIAVFFFGVEQENTGAIQVDNIVAASSFEVEP